MTADDQLWAPGADGPQERLIKVVAQQIEDTIGVKPVVWTSGTKRTGLTVERVQNVVNLAEAIQGSLLAASKAPDFIRPNRTEVFEAWLEAVKLMPVAIKAAEGRYKPHEYDADRAAAIAALRRANRRLPPKEMEK